MSGRPWYFYYLVAAISKIWSWSPARREALSKASVGDSKKCATCGIVIAPTTKTTKRGKKRKSSGVEVDHIDPCVSPATGFTTWDDYIHRKLGVTVDGLQILCLPCHKAKSAKEDKQRGNAA
jgi:5-methylcytosine-specific restriction endonuclease McrA